MNESTESYLDMCIKTIKENEKFLQSDDELEKIYTEILTLADDALGMYPLDNKFSDPWTEFVMNALQPLSQGIYFCALSGNIIACFMQLRLLIEYLALTSIASKNPGDNLLEKLEKVRTDYDGKRISDMIKNFDMEAYRIWKSTSEWHHAKSHSRRIEKTIIDEGVKLWSIIQPAPYYKEDKKELMELFQSIRQFRKILKSHRKLSKN